VVILSGYHGFLSATRKTLLSGAPPRASRFYRMVNEIPPVLTIVIVILVVVQPF
jgi:putative membrane protein